MDKNKEKEERLARQYRNFLYRKEKGSIPLVLSFQSYLDKFDNNLDKDKKLIFFKIII